MKDECNFEITNISEIKHDDKYDGLRVTILGKFHSLRFHFKLDLSTLILNTANFFVDRSFFLHL